jgi:hypothetical protein
MARCNGLLSLCRNPPVEDRGEGRQKPSNSKVTFAIPSADANIPYPLPAKIQVGTSIGLSCDIVVEMFVGSFYFTNV